LQEAAGEEFVLAVLESGRPDPLFTTGDQSSGELKQKKTLWLFPDYQVGIRMKGAGVEEILKARFVKNILLILVLDLIIIAGAWVVYRGIRREMELVRLKSDFVSNVSHELRTPLSVIRMYTETLEMGRIRDEEKKTEYLTTILRESERLTRLVNNILSFSRMEAGKKEFHLRSTDLNALVTQVLETYGPHLANEGFSPAVDLNPTISPVRADGEAVAEAIINLLDNAVKYSDREKYIRISTGTQDGMVFVAVEDRGIGIAPEHQQKVFDSFYRVSTGLVHTSKGSGIGLAIVRQIMEAHHGKVGLVSEVGKGSTFRVLFPVDPASKAGAVQS
jgi:two-component system phosphate regulon sensor histidine kinase PhoR